MERKEHILIIDDDEDIRRLFAGKLAKAGFEIMHSDNGNEGREMARRFQPDLILLDIRMPDTDGYKTAERLHDEPLTAKLPVVFLTNEDITQEAEKSLKETMIAGYIHKSTDLDKFVELVKKIISENKKKQ